MEGVKAIAAVRRSVFTALADLQSFCTIPATEGAFYSFIKVHTDLHAMTLVEQLIREHQVAVIPGHTFGMNEGCYLRVAFGALQPQTVQEGTERLISGLKSILKQG